MTEKNTLKGYDKAVELNDADLEKVIGGMSGADLDKYKSSLVPIFFSISSMSELVDKLNYYQNVAMDMFFSGKIDDAQYRSLCTKIQELAQKASTRLGGV